MKVAIVCGAPATEFMAPFEDEEWEIWVLGNRLNRFLDRNLRVTRIFEIHDDLSEHEQPENYAKWLVGQGLPLVVGEAFPVRADNVELFDFEASKELFGSVYLTSSPAYMVSYAISAGAEEIAIYGVDLNIDDHEYFWQRPNMEAWVGFAKGRGIRVTIPAESPLVKSEYVEGMGCGGKPDFSLPPFTQAAFLKMAEKHRQRIEQLRQQREELLIAMNAQAGAQQCYERMAQVARSVEAGVKVDDLESTVSIK